MTDRLRSGQTPQAPQTMVRRNIRTLEQVAPEVATIVARQDGVIANTPHDGFISPEEVAASLRSPLVDVLSPREQQGLAAVSRLLEWEGGPTHVAPTVPRLTLAPVHKVDPVRWPMPPAANINTPFPMSANSLSSLVPVGHFELAQRVQRVANGDGNAKTISLADIRTALQTHRAAFTEGDVAGLNKISAEMTAKLAAMAHPAPQPATPNVGWSIDLPGPGTTRTAVTKGPTALNIVSTTSPIGNQLPINRNVITRQNQFELVVPSGCKAVVMPSVLRPEQVSRPTSPGPGLMGGDAFPTGDEFVFDAGSHDAVALEPGEYLVETWRNGERIGEERVKVGRLPGSSSTPRKEKNGSTTSVNTEELSLSKVPYGTKVTVGGQRIEQYLAAPQPGVFETNFEGHKIVVTTRGEGPISISVDNHPPKYMLGAVSTHPTALPGVTGLGRYLFMSNWPVSQGSTLFLSFNDKGLTASLGRQGDNDADPLVRAWLQHHPPVLLPLTRIGA